MTLGSDGATASAPTAAVVNWPSVTHSQVQPPSVVFHTPPAHAPEVEGHRVGRAAGDGDHAAAAMRADAAPLERSKKVLLQLL